MHAHIYANMYVYYMLICMCITQAIKVLHVGLETRTEPAFRAMSAINWYVLLLVLLVQRCYCYFLNCQCKHSCCYYTSSNGYHLYC
jgi:hypothetical protein